jgi:hypothetical protein
VEVVTASAVAAAAAPAFTPLASHTAPAATGPTAPVAETAAVRPASMQNIPSIQPVKTRGVRLNVDTVDPW